MGNGSEAPTAHSRPKDEPAVLQPGCYGEPALVVAAFRLARRGASARRRPRCSSVASRTAVCRVPLSATRNDIPDFPGLAARIGEYSVRHDSEG
jgi:hypothetical protein